MSKLFRKIKFLIISMSLIFIIIGVVAFADFVSQKKTNFLPSSTEVKKNIGDTNTSQNNLDNKSSKNNSEENTESDNTTNILLLDNKSDSMVVASVDTANKDISFTPISNTGYFDRSNMENLLNNMEKNVNMNLDKFLQVDTSQLMNVISLLGDVSVNISSEDMELINNLIPKFYAEYDDKSKGEMKLIANPGVQSINEYQAMAYVSVLSKDSNKQKEAILSLVKNVKNLGFTKYVEIYNKIKPYVETNLTIPDMLQLASSDYEFK